MLRVRYDDLYAALYRAVLRLGLADERAAQCARLMAETTRDGVYSHGLNRFPRFATSIANGSVDVNAEPAKTGGHGALERWDGRRGVGNLNAKCCMQRAIDLAGEHGIGGVALANTNHWMRGGSYGWQAAEQGFFAICWTNTLTNLPAWGATTPTLGNNPLVMAVPRPGGHVVLDMAMSQFSYGTLAGYSKRGQSLPVDGGFDASGTLTKDAAAIEASQRALPVGYWKGSGLSIVLDMMAAMLSGGFAAHQIPRDPMRETGISQVFLAVDPQSIVEPSEMNTIAERILASLQQATPVDAGKPVRYPGEQTLQLREENTRLGVPVDPEIWKQISGKTTTGNGS
jgi:3-dehydro-L-gulonate 2-dehydrogenase